MILASSASLPLGMRLVGNALQITQPQMLDAWDFEGLEVFADADVIFNRPRFHNASGNAHFLHVGENGTAPKVSIVGGDLDASGLNSDTGEAAIQLATGELTTTGNRWHDAPRDYLTMQSGKWTATGDWFGLFGQSMSPGAVSGHAEPAHVNGGEVLIDGCMFDMRLLGRRAGLTGITATMLYLQARNAPIKCTIRKSIGLGAGVNDLNTYYPIQTNERAFGVLLDLRGNVIEPGIHGGVVGDTPAVGGKVKVTGAFNINAVTGQPLSVAA